MAAVTTTGNFIRCKWNFTHQGARREIDTVWWVVDTTPIIVDASFTSLTIYLDLWQGALQPLLHESLRLNTLDVITGSLFTNPDPTKREYSRFVDEAGSVNTSDSMPVWDAVVMRRYPDNTTVWSEDPDAPQFNKSYYGNGFSGVPEEYTANGRMTDAALALFNTAFTEFETLSVGVVDFDLMIVRQANVLTPGFDNSPAWVKALNTTAGGRLGTRVMAKN